MYLDIIVNTNKRGRKPTKRINLGNNYQLYLFKYKNKISGYKFLYENEIEKMRLISAGIKSYEKFK